MGRESPAAGLLPVFAEVHEEMLGPLATTPRLTFYPYTTTTGTIRKRGAAWHVRIHDGLAKAEDAVVRGLFRVLLQRAARLPARPHPDIQVYKNHLNEGVASQGTKHVDPIGGHHSLLESYLRVTLDMGLNIPEAPTLSWSKTRSKRRFGHHDPGHGVIVLSRTLDDPKVPEFVLDYVVYHELLHILHPPRPGSGTKRIIHGKAFRDAERKFPNWKEAEKWLGKLAR